MLLANKFTTFHISTIFLIIFLSLSLSHFFYSADDDNVLLPLNSAQSKANNLHHSHQHIFQHQSSVTSTTSVQTVYHQCAQQQNNSNNSGNINTSNPMILLGTSSSSASFQSANGSGNGMYGSVTTTASGIHYPSGSRLNQSGSISSLTSNNNVILQQQMSNSSNVSIAEEALNIGDVADLLHPQYAIITGGRSREGCPIITFPDHNNFLTLTEHDYEKLISYLTSVPP